MITREVNAKRALLWQLRRAILIEINLFKLQGRLAIWAIAHLFSGVGRRVPIGAAPNKPVADDKADLWPRERHQSFINAFKWT